MTARIVQPASGAARLALVSLFSVLAGCLSAPSSADWLAAGFRTPEQAFKTFQTALRSKEPEFEFRCFSLRFLEEHRISRPVYLAVREQLQSSNPLLWVGMATAELEGAPRIDGKRALLTVRALGKRVRVGLVREDFGQLWAGQELVLDESIGFDQATGAQDTPDGAQWMFGQLRLPAGTAAQDLTEIHLGREWKIDGVEEIVEPSSAARAREARASQPE